MLRCCVLKSRNVCLLKRRGIETSTRPPYDWLMAARASMRRMMLPSPIGFVYVGPMAKPEPGTMLPNDTLNPLASPVRSRYGKLSCAFTITRSALGGAQGVRFAAFSVRADSIRSVRDCA